MKTKEAAKVFCTWKWLGWSASAFLLYAVGALAGGNNEIQTELSLRVASTLCSLQEEYYENKVFFKEPISAVPFGVVSVVGCERILWTKCPSKDGSCTPRMEISSTSCSKKSSNSRIINGEVAQQDWNVTGNIDAPWDVNVRCIWYWGNSSGIFNNWEIENNNITGIREKHRCSGTIIANNTIITAGYCGWEGKDWNSGNRFVMWFARKRYRFNAWVQTAGGDANNPINGEIIFGVQFNYTEEIPESLDDIAVIKLHNFRGSTPGAVLRNRVPHRVDIYGLEIPEPSVEFETTASFAGWGSTIAKITGSNAQHGDNQGAYSNLLHKIDLEIVPVTQGACKAALEEYRTRILYLTDLKRYDWSEKHICAIAKQTADGKERGLCSGDIGGALVCTGKADKKKYFCGMRNSYGIPKYCPSPEKVEIFLKMSAYKGWIEKVTQQKQDPAFLVPGKNYYVCRFHCNSDENRK